MSRLSSSFGNHPSSGAGGFKTGCISSSFLECLIRRLVAFEEASVGLGRAVRIPSLWADDSPSEIFNLS